jgi:hypothetical protein
VRGAWTTALLVTAATAAGTAIAVAGPPSKTPGHTPGQTPGQTGCPKGKADHERHGKRDHRRHRRPGHTPGHTPGQTPGQTGCPKPGGKKGRPVVKQVKVKPAKFRVAKHTGSVSARAGARITYGASEAGTARFTVARRVRKRHHVNLPGSFSHGAVKGRNTLHFTGRLDGRALAPGRYTLKVKLVDLTGDVSRTGSARFRIVRR